MKLNAATEAGKQRHQGFLKVALAVAITPLHQLMVLALKPCSLTCNAVC